MSDNYKNAVGGIGQAITFKSTESNDVHVPHVIVDTVEGQDIVFQGDTSGLATAVRQDTGNAALDTLASKIDALAALVGAADDGAGDPTLIGLLKQIAANTTPA